MPVTMIFGARLRWLSPSKRAFLACFRLCERRLFRSLSNERAVVASFTDVTDWPFLHVFVCALSTLLASEGHCGA